MIRARHLALVSILVAGCTGDDGPGGEEVGDTSESGTGESESESGTDTTAEGESESETGEAPLLDDYPLVGDELFPEGVTFDPDTRRFVFGSLTGNQIGYVEADGSQGVLVSAPDPAHQTIGLDIDGERRRLWACSRIAESETGDEILVFDLDSGELVERLPLAAAAEGGRCNDVTVDPATGAAYATDSTGARVYAVTSVAPEGLELLSTDPLLEPETPSLGLNGLAVTPDGERLIVAKYVPARLVSLSLSDPSDIVEVALSGDAFEGEDALSGADGIEFVGERLYVVFNARLFAVEFADASWASATVSEVGAGLPSGLTTATEAEGGLYVITGQVRALLLGTPPTLPFRILRAN